MESVINMCTYKSCQISSSWMELQVQRNSPSAFPPSSAPSPTSVLSWVGGASNIEEGEGEGEGVEREGRDCMGNQIIGCEISRKVWMLT